MCPARVVWVFVGERAGSANFVYYYLYCNIIILVVLISPSRYIFLPWWTLVRLRSSPSVPEFVQPDAFNLGISHFVDQLYWYQLWTNIILIRLTKTLLPLSLSHLVSLLLLFLFCFFVFTSTYFASYFIKRHFSFLSHTARLLYKQIKKIFHVRHPSMWSTSKMFRYNH